MVNQWSTNQEDIFLQVYNANSNTYLQWSSFYKFHHYTVSVEINRFRNRKVTIMQSLHVCKFLGGWDTRQVQPWGSMSMLMVVTFLFQISKTRTTKPTKGIKIKLTDYLFHLPQHVRCSNYSTDSFLNLVCYYYLCNIFCHILAIIAIIYSSETNTHTHMDRHIYSLALTPILYPTLQQMTEQSRCSS